MSFIGRSQIVFFSFFLPIRKNYSLLPTLCAVLNIIFIKKEIIIMYL